MSSSSPLLKDVRVVGGVALAIGLFAGLSLTSTFARTPAPAADKGSHTGKAESPQKTKKEGAQTGGWRTRRGSLPFPGELKTIPLEARQVQDLRAAKVRRDPPEEIPFWTSNAIKKIWCLTENAFTGVPQLSFVNCDRFAGLPPGEKKNKIKRDIHCRGKKIIINNL